MANQLSETETSRLGPARMELLRARSKALQGLRSYFAKQDFVEIEPPHLVRAPGMEPHLRPIRVGSDGWLITSPEFHLKRLLAAGMPRIFSVCRCFRDDEAGIHHSKEFTMVEWYRAEPRLESLMDDVEGLVSYLRVAMGLPSAPGKWKRITVREAMRQFSHVDVIGDESAKQLAEKVKASGVDVGQAEEWDDIFFCAFLDRVEPALKRLCEPVFVTEWPLPLSALARQISNRPVVERFELYANGLELANAFGELTCAREQQRRFDADQKRLAELGQPPRPLDRKFLRALEEGMPESAGIALGFDRLLMWLLGVENIADLQAFADEEV